ncbi:vWA domain-containing protein [Ornithinicoccus halotolerans]|uniref:vWA domain-containing protein n=1 Tax=Ornithinicoccus halotolerans TaxID=1748220 RepID=UPI00188648F9|nr:VWA domain-containing protein [Ornithinicoccus halotolerans]
MTRATGRPVVAAAAGLALLAGCGGGDPPEAAVEPSADAAAATSAGPDEAVQTADAGTDEEGVTATAAGGFRAPEVVPVPFDDAPRELTALERSLLREPGPYAGDGYDQDAVIEAARSHHPTTAEEWGQAILAQIHEDYAADVMDTVRFDPSIAENAADPEEQQPEEGQAVGSNHVALVLDASGSMAADSANGSRMDEAKAAMLGFVESLPEGTFVTLRVYGHEGNNLEVDKEESCASSELVFDGPAAYLEGLEGTLGNVEPTGWTPLAMAIRDAAADVPADATDSIVYVVTDGIESCGGDPVAAAKKLAGSGIEPIVNVVGFQTGDADTEQLQAIAAAGGGEFTAAGSQQDLEDYWDEEYSRMMSAWNEWRSEALKSINEQGRANMREADEVGQRIMAAANREKDRGMDISEALADELEYEVKTGIWRFFYDRGTEIWRYGYDTKTANWSAAYDQKVTRWQDAYRTGTAKWSEYYEKRTG